MADIAGQGRQRVDVLLRHGRIITMDAERRILPDGAIAVRGHQIAAIGPDCEVASTVEPVTVRDLEQALVHPGFVDTHTHTNKELLRGLIPESMTDWMEFERPFLETKTPEEEYLGAMLSCMEMVANGTTLYVSTGDALHPDAEAQAIRTVGLRAIPGYLLADLPSSVARLFTPTDACLARLVEQIERFPFASDGRIRCVATLWGMVGKMASDRLLVEASALAERYGVPMIMHQSWGEDEVQACLAKTGKRPIEHLAVLGILRPTLTLVHMIHLSEREVDLVAESGTQVVHCPSAAIRRGVGAARVGRIPEMLARGVTVALGSDGHSGKRDVVRQAYLAATLHREVRGQFPVISAYTALEMATIHGARAAGLQAEVGSLEVGKRADLVVHAIDRPETRPHFRDPVPNLIYNGHARTVDTVMVDGEVLFDRGRFARFDAHDVFRQIDATAAVIERRLSPGGRGPWPLVV